MLRDPLLRAWLALIVLSAGTALVTTLSSGTLDPHLAGGLTLLFALAKARIILARYLGLSQAPRWFRGFNTAIVIFGMFLFGLYMAGTLVS